MDTFQLWKLATDVALVLSILYLCVRFMRTQGPSVNPRELRDLEIVLKNLLRDADVASRTLGDSLSRRQESLERLLAEFEGGERRMAAALQSAEQLRSKLSRGAAPSQAQAAPVPVEAEVLKASKPALPPAQALEVSEDWAEPPSFESDSYAIPARVEKKKQAPVSKEASADEAAPRRTGEAAYRATQARHQAAAAAAAPEEASSPAKAAPAASRENIYGELIDDSSEAAPVVPPPTPAPTKPRGQRKKANQSLSKEIEIERLNETQAARERATVQEVYDAAEKLLAAGENMETVAATTRLPLDEVRKLARIARRVEQARSGEASTQASKASGSSAAAASADPTADPRLGVFANIRRQTQVL